MFWVGGQTGFDLVESIGIIMLDIVLGPWIRGKDKETPLTGEQGQRRGEGAIQGLGVNSLLCHVGLV